MTTATSIPADWDLADPATWRLSQAANAHLGTHAATGMVMRELQHIRLAATDLDDGETVNAIDGGEDPAVLAEWWHDVLDGMMAGRVAIAEASPEAVEAAKAELGVFEWDDLSDGDLDHEAANGRKIAALLNQETGRNE